jgi:YD repeat-containing protein
MKRVSSGLQPPLPWPLLIICLLVAVQFIDGAMAQAPSSRVATFDRYDPTMLSYAVSGIEGESIDPRTLHVSWEVTDLIIPGNGGLDINISRSFGKLAHTPSDMGHWYMGVPRIQIPASPWRGPVDPANAANDTFQSAWYNLHARLNYGASGMCQSAGYLVDPYFTTSISNQQILGIMYAAPITLYIPGEGAKLLLEKLPQATQFPADATYVTTDNWYARCITPDQNHFWGGFEVFSPNGTRYVFDFIQYLVPGDYALGTNGGWAEMGISFIEDVHGNWLYYNYDLAEGGNALLKQIEASDGRLVEYEWHPDSVLGVDVQGSPLSLLTKVHYTVGGQRQSIEYSYCDFADMYILEIGCNPIKLQVDGDLPVLNAVKLANGFTTQYSYNGDMYSANVFLDWGGFEFILDKVTLPTGGEISYEYHPGFSAVFQNTDSPAPRLQRRTTSGTDVVTGEWNYTYSLSGHIETSTIATVGRTDTYEFYEGVGTYEFQIAYLSGNYSWPDYAPYDYDEIMGRLRNHTVSDGSALLKTSNFEYGLANYIGKSWYGGNWLGYPTLVLAQLRPLPITLTTITDWQAGNEQAGGLEYTTATPLAEFDEYMQPLAVYETGHDGATDDANLSRVTHYSWHNTVFPWLVGLPAQITRGQFVIDYDYVPGSSLISREERYGIVSEFDYNPDGTLNSKRWLRDAVVYASKYEDYYLGVPRYERHPIDPVVGNYAEQRRGVDELGRIIWEEDASANRTQFSYDPSGFLTAIVPPVSAPVSVAYSLQSGVLDSLVKTQSTREQSIQLDDFGRISATIDGGNSAQGRLELAQVTRYDGQGRAVFESYPFAWAGPVSAINSQGHTYRYDAFGRTTLRTNTADGGELSYCYMQVCNTSEYAQFFDATLENGFIVSDERGYATAYEHRAFGSPESLELTRVVQQVSKAAEPGGASFAVTILTRDPWGNITGVSQGDGVDVPVSRSYVYDVRQLLIEEQHPETGVTRHEYDEVGNLLVSVDAEMHSTSRAYDGLNRLTSVNYSGATPSVKTRWSPNGLVTSVNNSTASWGYAYDAENKLIDEDLITASTYTVFTYGYNSLGHRDEIVYPDGRRFALQPDDFGRPQQFGSVALDVAYHPDGTVGQLEYGNGFQLQLPQTARLLPAGRLLEDTAGQAVVDISFSYDLAANLVSINDTGGWLHDRSLAYDGLQRLVGAEGYWGEGSLAYDGVGNLQEKNVGKSTLNYQYDAANRLKAVSGLTYDYDLLGNVLSDGLSNYNYNSASQLASSDTQVGVSYAYDGNGRRTLVRTPDGTQVDVYNRSGQLMYSDQCAIDDQTVNYYHLGDELIAREEVPCDRDSGCH